MNYNSQPEPVRPSQLGKDNYVLIDTSTANPSRILEDSQLSHGRDSSALAAAAALLDPSKIIKQMSQDQIVQLLKDPEISRILKESMLQQEKEAKSSGGADHSEQLRHPRKHREIDPFTGLEAESHGAHPVDLTDPSILGNEFEVPQEKTLNTEDFAFGLLPSSTKDKPKLFVGQPEDFLRRLQDGDDSDQQPSSSEQMVSDGARRRP